jgi:hypothetical protein
MSEVTVSLQSQPDVLRVEFMASSLEDLSMLSFEEE